MDLTIKPYITNKNRNIIVHKNLPTIPFVLLLNAQRKSGKTTIICNILRLMMKYFKHIIIFSPTTEIDETFKSFYNTLNKQQKKKFMIYDEFNENILNKFVDYKKKYTNSQDIIIFDDIMGELGSQYSLKNSVSSLVKKHRHYNISLIFSSQYFNLTPPIIRNNLSGLIIFKLNNIYELEKISKMIPTGDLNIEQFIKIYQYATKPTNDNPKPFLFINFEHDFKDMFYKTFKEQINIDRVLLTDIYI